MSFQTIGSVTSARTVKRIPFAAVTENLRENPEFRNVIGIPDGRPFDADHLALSYAPAVYSGTTQIAPACVVATYDPAGGLSARKVRGRKPGSKKSTD